MSKDPGAHVFQYALLPAAWEPRHGRPPPWKFRRLGVGSAVALCQVDVLQTGAVVRLCLDYSPGCHYKVTDTQGRAHTWSLEKAIIVDHSTDFCPEGGIHCEWAESTVSGRKPV